jgi:prepilin-type N-terminal cleavage/methylation domain-containing protein
MINKKENSQKRGFTLVELLIVILIVSIVYFLGFSGVELGEKKLKALTPLNLKSTFLKTVKNTNELSLLCVNHCKTCYLRKGINTSYQPYKNNINLHDVTVYTLDRSDSLVPIEYERYNDQKVCLQMDFYSNGSSTQLVLENKNGVYFLPSYFDKPHYFQTLEEAETYWITQTKLVSDRGEFY